MKKDFSLRCPICGQQADFAYFLTILKKYKGHCFLCEKCDFFFLKDPFWLPEAYSEAIAVSDTGIVARNLLFARIMRVLLVVLGLRKRSGLDFAGGSGLFVRLMRDAGFSMYWEDAHAINQLARGFDYQSCKAEICLSYMTAFEVVEHLPSPRDLLERAFGEDCVDYLFFSTIFKNKGVPPKDWWYLSPSSGQHISFLSEHTCHYLAQEFGLHFYRGGKIHLFSRRPVEKSIYRLFSGRLSYAFLPLVFFSSSLTKSDYESLS